MHILRGSGMSEKIVLLPSLGNDAGEKATVSFVCVNAGDTVKEGDILVQMVTDKAVFDVPSQDAGTVEKVFVTEGDDVTVGDNLCVLNMA